MSSNRTIVQTDKAPAAIGPYSQGVTVGNLTFVSGQIPLNPDTMKVESEDFGDQAEQVFKNLKAVTEASGASLADIAKLTVFLTDLSNFAEVNEVMQRYFSAPFPARAAIGVASLPLGVHVEIEAIVAR